MPPGSATTTAPGPPPRLFGRAFAALRYDTASRSASSTARVEIIHAAFDRLEARLGDDDYLVGDRFTVADLTAANLFYPVGSSRRRRCARRRRPPLRALSGAAARRRGFRWVPARSSPVTGTPPASKLAGGRLRSAAARYPRRWWRPRIEPREEPRAAATASGQRGGRSALPSSC